MYDVEAVEEPPPLPLECFRYACVQSLESCDAPFSSPRDGLKIIPADFQRQVLPVLSSSRCVIWLTCIDPVKLCSGVSLKGGDI